MTEQSHSDALTDPSPARVRPRAAMPNGIPPRFDLPIPDRAEVITANVLKLTEGTPNQRLRFILQALIKHLHEFVNETDLTTDEWMAAIQFMTRVGQASTPSRDEMSSLSSILGMNSLVDALNNPTTEKATESSLLGPFYTDDTPIVSNGGSIASEGNGEYLYVEGCVLNVDGVPIPDAIIDAWETDADGRYDLEYTDRSHPDCRGRLRSAKDGTFGFRAVVPSPYAIPNDGPVAELLLLMNRHNMRPSHLHIAVQAPGYRKLVTQFFPEDCTYLQSDCVFGVKKSLLVKLELVNDEAKARERGFPDGASFKLMRLPIILSTDEQFKAHQKSEETV
ncbi:Intradiol ring-cleavage dioxygenase [Scleroderma yunnanense]